MKRFLADENFSGDVVVRLRELGYDIITVQQLGKSNQRWPDELVFKTAIADARAILTKNRRDYYRLHKSVPKHPGIVACTEDGDCERATNQVHKTLSSLEDIRGQFIRVYKPAR